MGLAARIPLGFGNSYALGMRRKDAERLGIRKVSDLPKHAALRFGLSHEFLGRRDGWPGLQSAYGLPQKPRGLDHGIAYEALAAGEIDVMDLYTTDAKIERYAHRRARGRPRASFLPTTRCCCTGPRCRSVFPRLLKS